MLQRLKKLLKNPNVVRAAVIYVGSLLIGVLGFIILDPYGWYALTCVPGLGSGVALALLNNGHKKPVTYQSVISTIVMSVMITVIMIMLSAPLLSVALGMGLSFLGSYLGFWFCRWESLRETLNVKRETIAKNLVDVFDEDMNATGVIDKAEAHEKLLWHKSAHIWVTDGERVLVHLRAPEKAIFPNRWAASAAAH